MKRECESCIKRKTPYCPNSTECMATDDMPYYQNRIMLLKENQDLKKQLENKYEKVGTLTSELLYEENTKLINQQKEFINYLQKEINQYTTHIEAIDSVCTSIYSSDYDNSKIKLAIYKEILQKYKEIIQTKNNNSV